jgi:hypothetical protein
MGFMDKVKGLFGGRKDQGKQETDTAAGPVEEKPGGSQTDQITSAPDTAKENVEKLGDGG